MRPDMYDFTGKTVMVTGGGTGIGAAIVERFALAGANVACCYNKSVTYAQVLADALSAKGKSVFLVKMDVSKNRAVEVGIEAIQAHFGRDIDILVNNAGDVFASNSIEEMDEELWDMTLAVNLKGMMLCAKHCIPGMKKAGWGRIINTSSISAHSGGGPGASHYAASKAGVESLTRSLCKELGSCNITANAVAPGVVYTPIHERTNTPESLEKLRQLIPLQRLGKPEEVAGVVLFLASEDASYITGEVIAINGGMRLD